MATKEQQTEKHMAQLESIRLGSIQKRLSIKRGVAAEARARRAEERTEQKMEEAAERRIEAEERRTVAAKKKVKEDYLKKQRKQVVLYGKRITTASQMLSKSMSPELKAQRIAQLQAYRAKKKQLEALRTEADRGVQYPNKFKRIAKAREMRLDEMDANRRFHAPDPNHATEMNRLHQRERDRRQEDERKFSLLKAHENMADVRIDFTDMSKPENNILAAPNIWASDNPANRNIMITGRPGILTPNPQDRINREKARLRFF